MDPGRNRGELRVADRQLYHRAHLAGAGFARPPEASLNAAPKARRVWRAAVPGTRGATCARREGRFFCAGLDPYAVKELDAMTMANCMAA